LNTLGLYSIIADSCYNIRDASIISISENSNITNGSVHMSIHTITYVLFTKKSFSEPLQEFDFSLTGSQILRNSQVLLNKYFTCTYNFSCKLSKTFSKTDTFNN